jgi:cold-inducible RNA-binding protein
MESSRLFKFWERRMSKKLYVGNLPYGCSSDDLADLFATIGSVSNARVITDRETGRSKGFGFVEMSSDDESDSAVAQLNGQPFMGRPLTVNEARPRENEGRSGRSSGYEGYSA